MFDRAQNTSLHTTNVLIVVLKILEVCQRKSSIFVPSENLKFLGRIEMEHWAKILKKKVTDKHIFSQLTLYQFFQEHFPKFLRTAISQNTSEMLLL